jgi:hypothetical protein
LSEFAQRHCLPTSEVGEVLERLGVCFTATERRDHNACRGRCPESYAATVSDAVKLHRLDCPTRVAARKALCVEYARGQNGNVLVSLRSLGRDHRLSTPIVRRELVYGGVIIRPPHRPKSDHLWRHLPV